MDGEPVGVENIKVPYSTGKVREQYARVCSASAPGVRSNQTQGAGEPAGKHGQTHHLLRYQSGTLHDELKTI